jgi:hypothetical protein
LFHCAAGAGEPTSLWYYLMVTSDEVAQLETTSEEALTTLPFDAPGGVVALAGESVGILGAVVVDDFERETLNRAVRELVDELETLTSSARELTPA